MVAYSLKELSNDKLKYEYSFYISDNDIDVEMDNKVREYSTKIKMPGFRVGKVSPSVVRQKFGIDIRKEIVELAFKEAYKEIGDRFNLATNIDIKLDTNTSNKNSAILKFEILPKIPDIDLSTINVDNFICDIEDSDIDQEIKFMKERQKNFVVKEGKEAVDGDAVDVDFKIFVDDKLIKGGEAKNYRIILGDGQMIKGFEDGLHGMKANESKVFDFIFPDNYQSPNVAGKEAKADVKIVNVLLEEKIDSNDDLIKVLGCTKDELRVNTKESLYKKADTMIRSIKIRDLFSELDQKIDCFVPQVLLNKEENALHNDSNLNTLSSDVIKAIAVRRVKIGLFLMDISNKNNLKLSNDDITRYVTEQIGDNSKYGRELLNLYMKDEKSREAIARGAMEAKSIDFALTKVTFNDKKSTFVALKKEYDAIDNDLFVKNKSTDTVNKDNKDNNKKKSTNSESKIKTKSDNKS